MWFIDDVGLMQTICDFCHNIHKQVYHFDNNIVGGRMLLDMYACINSLRDLGELLCMLMMAHHSLHGSQPVIGQRNGFGTRNLMAHNREVLDIPRCYSLGRLHKVLQ